MGDRLVEFSAEILDEWFSFVPSKESWKGKFERNAGRMKTNFQRGQQRCGHYDENQLPHGGPEGDRKRRSDDDMDRYNREDPSDGMKQITTGFRKWAERYIAACSGQRQYQHQVKRMSKWNGKLQAHLAGNFTPVKNALSCEWSNQVKGVGSQNAYPTCSDGKTIQIISAEYGRWSQDVCYRPDGKHMGYCKGSADHTNAVAAYVMVKQTVFIMERTALPVIHAGELPSTLLSNTNVFEQSNTVISYSNNLKVFIESSV